MTRIIWRVRYALLALRSRYEFTPFTAWEEAGASWDAWDEMRGEEVMPSPLEAIREDALEWRYG